MSKCVYLKQTKTKSVVGEYDEPMKHSSKVHFIGKHCSDELPTSDYIEDSIIKPVF